MKRLSSAWMLTLACLTTLAVATLGCFLAVPLGVNADEVRYSLGSIQRERDVDGAIGGDTVTILGFYNIDGNVRTIVEVAVAEAPHGWSVTLERHGVGSSGSDVVSLSIPPSYAHPVAPDCSGEQNDAVWIAPRGYVCTESVEVRIGVPEDSSAGTVGTVRVVAVASWETNGTSAPFPQEKEFVFQVTAEAPTVAQPGLVSANRAADGIPLPFIAGVCVAGLAVLLVLLAKSG